MSGTPHSQGYRMPAEWEPHEATWIAWPHHRDDWPGKFAAIPWVYAEIVRHLHSSERVRICVQNAKVEAEARQILQKAGVNASQIDFYPFRTNRVWTRDSGPLFLVHPLQPVALTDWQFNGWAKYDNWRQDNQLPRRVAKALGMTSWQPRVNRFKVVLEGGSIDVNGQGLLLTTEECLLSEVQQRNPGLNRADLEWAFQNYLGVQKTLWLNKGIAGDDTHGHVDDLARFAGPRTVVTVVEEDSSDANYEPLQENLQRLRDMTDLDNNPLEVVTLPMPRPLVFDDTRLPASYANFYIGNTVVLVPTFNDPNDRKALGILADLFPQGTVIGIHALDLVWGLGTLHCLTQQQPKNHSFEPGPEPEALAREEALG
jgi:agmatine deiminase